MIKNVFLDIDGSLIKTDGSLTEQTIKVIREANFSTTLVSARAPFEMQTILHALGVTGPQIGFNGGIIFRQGRRHRYYWNSFQFRLIVVKN